MSTFCGRMREYNEISIDRFDGDNVNSTVFFLSHCHRDHMVGLSYRSFAERLQTGNNIYLYMTDVSKVLLMGDNSYNFHPLEPYIKTLQIKQPYTITIPCNTAKDKPKLVSVTLLPAGHCPGSVMFLFEGYEGTVLYTGDFRWEKDKAASLSHLHNELGIKRIKSLYIDTTFCVPNALHFPSRFQCVEVTVQLIKEWLSHSRSHFVYIASPMNYGHEHLQVEIFKHTNEPVHTSDWKYSIYTQIQDLAMAYTTDPSARIHACGLKRKLNSKSFLPCGHLFDTEDEVSKLLVVRPSTMWFTMSTIRSEKLIEEPSNSFDPHRVCYSLHSSYSEIKNFVSYLNPDEVFPNVIPAQEPNSLLVQARLNSFLKPREISPSQEPPNYSLGNLNVKLSVKRIRSPSLSGSDDLMFDSPVKKPKVPLKEAVQDKRERSSLGEEIKAKLGSVSESIEKQQTDKAIIYTDSKKCSQEAMLSNEGSPPVNNGHGKGSHSSLSKNNDDINCPSSSPTGSKCHSSYQGSEESGSELDLFSSQSKDSINDSPVDEEIASLLQRDDERIRSWEEEDEAYRLYISSDDSDVDDDQTVSLDQNVVTGNLDDKNSQKDYTRVQLPFLNSSANEQFSLKENESARNSTADNCSVNGKKVDNVGDCSVNCKNDLNVGDCTVNVKTDLNVGDCTVNGKTDLNFGDCSVNYKPDHTVGNCSVNGKTDHNVGDCSVNCKPDHNGGDCSVNCKLDHNVGDCSVYGKTDRNLGDCSVNGKTDDNIPYCFLNNDACSVNKNCESQRLNHSNNLSTNCQEDGNSDRMNVNEQTSDNQIGRNKTKTASNKIDVIIINDDSNQANKLLEDNSKCQPENETSPISFKSKITPTNQLSPTNVIDSDSDVTLPPSQNMLTAHYDSDSDVEILYEENDFKEQSIRQVDLELVLDTSPNTKSNDDNFIDLTEESQNY